MPARYAVERRHWDEAAAITLPRRDALAAMSGTAHLVQIHRGAGMGPISRLGQAQRPGGTAVLH